MGAAGTTLILEFYGLRTQPFGATPDPRFTYLGRSYREALASICIGVPSGHGVLALIAPPGLGKTMLLFQLLELLKRNARTVYVFHTQCDGEDLLRQIVRQLGDPYDDHDAMAMHDALGRILHQEQRLGRRVVLVVDEAHNLEPAALETIRLLSDFETPTRKLLQIVLAGQPRLAERLLEPELAPLRQRIPIVARIDPMTEGEALAYVRQRLKVAGSADSAVFDEEALRLVARETGGVPREINNVLSNALCLGCAVGSRPIGRPIISEVLEDRDLRPLCRQEESGPRTLNAVCPALSGRVADVTPLVRRDALAQAVGR